MTKQQPELKELQFTVKERAVLYARVSGDDRGKEGRNLTGQLEMGREYAQGKEYNVVAELAEDDRGASGYEIDLPQLDKVREMAQAGQFDVLVVREIDRLSRNLAKQLIVEEELRRYGVEIEYVLAEYEDSPEGRLNKHIRATVAEYEREKIKERLGRGKRNKVKAGKVIVSTRPPYGYQLKDSLLVIYEPEAKIVRLIFQWYTQEGLSHIAIAQRLTEMHVPTRTGKDRWDGSVIGKILNNETYAGRWHYGKVNRREGQTNDRDKWLVVEVPAIVSDEVFTLAREIAKQNTVEAKRNTKYDYLLWGEAVKCGECNRNCGRVHRQSKTTERRYYACPSAKYPSLYDEPCKMPYFRGEKLDAMAWDWLKSIMSDPERLEEKLNEYNQKQDVALEPIRQRLSVVNDLLDTKQAERKRWLKMCASGLITEDEAKEQVQPLDRAITDLQQQQENYTARLQVDQFSEDEIMSLLELSGKMAYKLDLMDNDLDEQRWYIKRLKFEAVLLVEACPETSRRDGKRRVRFSCVLGEETMSYETPTSCDENCIGHGAYLIISDTLDFDEWSEQ